MQEGYLQRGDHRTWYGISGDITQQTPLVVLHGGPGYPHDYLRNLTELGVPVVFYDQLGCGRSDQPDDPTLWTIPFFLDELADLRTTLGLERINLLGHSWGGALALEYLLTEPVGVQRLVLASPVADAPMWVREAARLRETLPTEVQAALTRHEQAGTTDHAEYIDAAAHFNKRFICRARPKPAGITAADYSAGDQVYETMWGPSESYPTGTLKDWSVLERLHHIKTPTCITSGRYDEATIAQMWVVNRLIKGSQWTIFEDSAHFSNCEEPQQWLDVVGRFLRA